MSTTHPVPIAIDITVRFDDKASPAKIAKHFGHDAAELTSMTGEMNWDPIWESLDQMIDGLDRDGLIELIRSGVKLRIDGE